MELVPASAAGRSGSRASQPARRTFPSMSVGFVASYCLKGDLVLRQSRKAKGSEGGHIGQRAGVSSGSAGVVWPWTSHSGALEEGSRRREAGSFPAGRASAVK